MTTIDTEKLTPMMVQWHECKKCAKDAILFFRLGDFYEVFHDDAVLAAGALELTLTKRQEIPMAGVPCHTVETYIDRLIAKGFKVAIAEQMEDPKNVKGIVKREVVRVVTRGTVLTSSLLSEKANNYFACICQIGKIFALCHLDMTTAEFKATEFDSTNELLNELFRLDPAECLIAPSFEVKHPALVDELKRLPKCTITLADEWFFEHKHAHNFLIEHFKVHSLDGYGLKGMSAAINAAGALLRQLKESLSLPVDHLNQLSTYSTQHYLNVDRLTERHLELCQPLFETANKNGTLLGTLDKTKTPMGARLLRNWISKPLQSLDAIKARQEVISGFLNARESYELLENALERIGDLERLTMKTSTGSATPRDLVALKDSLKGVPFLKKALLPFLTLELISEYAKQVHEHEPLINFIDRALVDEPPARLSDGKFIREGFNVELDELREISQDSKTWMAKYQEELRATTGVKTLKVSYNKLFGYYIEASRGQAEKMPDSFQRKQTLVNAERFVTAELKEYESKVLNAEERISAIENHLFWQIKQEVYRFAATIQETALAIGKIDCLSSLAKVAIMNNYVRPTVDDSYAIEIKGGRHPVLESAYFAREPFIPNDTDLDGTQARMMLITGPNMAGKSTYLRQVALIVLMAHMGSYVPVDSARIGLVDKIFTRIGASDDLSRGQSTFMVEMTETANILNNASKRSLVILDEIGRGTSTYDGISIAWSVAEYLLTAEEGLIKTLFATHYWELTKLEEKIPGAINYNVAVNECGDQIVFLRKIIKGGTDKSYGIHVGTLAGLPPSVVERAREILAHLEENANRKSAFEPAASKKPFIQKKRERNSTLQLTFFNLSD